MKVSDQLRQAIRDSGLSQRQLARDTKIAASTIGRFVHGSNALTSDHLDTLAKRLGWVLTPAPDEAATKPSEKPAGKPTPKTGRKATARQTGSKPRQRRRR